MKKFIFRKNNLLDKINLSKYICNHLVGENHTHNHRIFAGVIIMILGVGLVKVTALIDIGLVHFIGDIAGYCIHGVGAIPIIKKFEENG